ncbi:MAG: SemiSWEET family transporter [Bacteroidales bacterium]|jgi:MtN3 and saliva related transmembrane protein|nr:SemiSWEET family transporter [Bacteroidales bacterium]MDD2618888.1 SemiSWEET family transporter [Bacteroidales bacterium]MDD4641691.1 SemiSWEET family transporter [Bacteroidales bacterium]NLB02979.1 glutathione synthetase [Bacteroidales bacterium]
MHFNSIEYLGLAAALFSTVNQMPQAWKIIRSKDTSSISLYTYSLLWIAVSLWLIYGITIKDKPLIISNIISIIPISYIYIIKLRNALSRKESI